MNSKQDIAVIGAGPSGLAACKVLREHGFSPTCYEAGERVGGQWVIENARSACYRSVVTNTHKGMLRYSDFGPDPSSPDFPDHLQMAQYFEDYAKRFELHQFIQFSTRVTEASRLDAGRWCIETDRGNGGEFDALVVCVGRYGEPKMPDIPEQFSGEIIHSQQYLDPEDPVLCLERDVLVIGLGNTACDLAVELSSAGAAGRVLLSARSGAHIVPRRPNGKLAPAPHPADALAGVIRLAPSWMRDSLMRALLPLAFRQIQKGQIALEEVNLPPPIAPPNPRNIVANDHVLERLRAGAIEARPAIQSWEGRKVQFVDGRWEEVDVVIAATGYDVSLPFFGPELPNSLEDLKLYRGILHPEHHNLYFLGLIMGLCSNWPFAEQQAIWVANHLKGQVVLPNDQKMLADSETASARSRKTLNCQFSAEELRCDYLAR